MKQLFELFQEAIHIRTHFELLLWLQGGVQQFLPHDVLIAAWGDFSLGLIHYDIVSPLPDIRTESISPEDLNPILIKFFNHWQSNGHIPFSLSSLNGILDFLSESSQVRTAIVHAIKDQRGRHDCLYVLISHLEAPTTGSRTSLDLILPYVDISLRQISPLPNQVARISGREDSISELHDSLSQREHEIMHWVLAGKTNQEIGIIMDISAFTVKNHLKRIFRKLDVLNRAQAASKFKSKIKTQ